MQTQTAGQRQEYLLDFIKIQTGIIKSLQDELQKTISIALEHPEAEIVKQYFTGVVGQNHTYYVKGFND